MKLPEKMIFELSRVCPWQCAACQEPSVHSRSRLRGHEISAGEWMAVTDEFLLNGVRHFIISGGDPFCKDGVCEILKYIVFRLRSASVSPLSGSIKCFSTGELISDETLLLLKHLKIELVLAFPGFDSCTELSGGCVSFREILEKIHHFSSSGVAVSVSCTAVSRNISELGELSRLALTAGAGRVYFTPYNSCVRLSDNPSYRLSAADMQTLGSIVATSEKCVVYDDTETASVNPLGVLKKSYKPESHGVYWRDWKSLFMS